MGRIRSNLASRVKKGKMSQAAADAAMGHVVGTLDYALFSSVDMVIEAVIEDIGLKQRIFADLEKHCRWVGAWRCLAAGCTCLLPGAAWREDGDVGRVLWVLVWLCPAVLLPGGHSAC